MFLYRRKIYLHLSFYFFILSVISCTHYPGKLSEIQTIHEDYENRITHKSFAEQHAIQFNQTGISGALGELAVMDSFLIGTDLRGDTMVHIIGLKSKRKFASVVTRGRGKDDCLNIANIIETTDKNIFWIYDVTLGKFQKIDIQKAIQNKNYTPEKKFVLTEEVKGTVSPCWINDSLFAACSYMLDDCRYFSFNDQSKILSKTGTLPQAANWTKQSTETKFSLISVVYSATLKRHPSKDLCVVSYKNTDRMEIYKEGKLAHLIKGPDLFEPHFDYQDKGNGIFIPRKTNETKYSHVRVYPTEKYIYSVYSGSKKTCSDKILVFDWSGNAIKVLTSDIKLCTIAIGEDGDRAVLYTLDDASGELVSATL
jgi:hypothetical protein